MKKRVTLGLKAILMSILVVSCNKDDENTNQVPATKTYEEVVAVANRSGASVSFIDANTNQVTTTLPIMGSMPMYVVYVPTKDKVYVGDRSGKKVHIINPKTKAIESSITVGNGVFHMWADGLGKQLWVANDTDNTISVIDLNTNTVVQTINVGMDHPHDVFLSKDGTKAYISLFNADTTMPDKIYLYNTTTFAKTGEVTVGKDPHLYHLPNSNKLFVPCRSGQVYTLNGNDLSVISNNAFEGALGISPSPDQNTLFVSNFVNGQLYSINTATSMQIGMPKASLSAAPRDITVNEAGNKMFVTHAGATTTTVSTYPLTGSTIGTGTAITVGANPFGLTYYKREVK